MLMDPTGSLSSTPKPHGLLQRDLQWIHPPYLVSLVLTLLSLMNPLMQTKLFKNQNGEVFARYIRTNCRNGLPMKKVWVPKRCLENLPVNVIMTPQVKKTNPRPQASYGPKSSYRQRTHMIRTNTNVLQGSHTQANE